MPFSKHTQDLCYYKLLHFLGKWLSVLPNFRLSRIEKYRASICYPLVMVVLAVAMYIYDAYGKFTVTKGFLAPSVFICDVAVDAITAIATVMAIVNINLCKGRQVCKMLAGLLRTDAEFRKLNEKLVVYPAKQYLAEMTVILVCFTTYMVYNIYIWYTTVGFGVLRYFIMRDFQNLQILIAAMMMSSYAMSVTNRVNILISFLHNLRVPNEFAAKVFTVPASSAGLKLSVTNEELTVRKLRKIFVGISKVVEDYNEVFGWLHVIMYVNIIVNLINPMNLVLVYAVGGKPFNGGPFSLEMVILCLIWTALPAIVATWIFSSCDHGAAAIKRIPNNCNCIIQQFDETNGLTIELEKFAQQVSNTCTEFSAAGFFPVNYNTYFSLIGSMTTYLIVLIQFR